MLPRQGRRDSRGRADHGRGDTGMRPHAQVRWLQLKVGLVIIAAVAGILVAIMNLNEGMGLFRQQATFRALVDDSHGIKVGAPVRLNGVDTGNVIRIAIDSSSGKVSLTFTINQDIVPLLRRDAAVLIRPMGLLGDKYLELLPGTPKEPPLQNGSVLTGQAESDITSLADSATVTLENVDRSLGRLAQEPSWDQRLDSITTNSDGRVERIEGDDGTLGKWVTQDQLYQRADKVLTEMDNLLADVRKNPTKYFKSSVF